MRRKSKAKKEKVKKPKKVKAPKEKKAKKPAPVGADGIALPKPATNVYMVMLMLSVLFIVVSCIVLYMHLTTYGSFPQWRT